MGLIILSAKGRKGKGKRENTLLFDYLLLITHNLLLITHYLLLISVIADFLSSNYTMTYQTTNNNLYLITSSNIVSRAQENFFIHASVNSKAKRLLDICGAIVGLMITAILFIPIAVAISLDSPGAILFSQTRCGYKGRKFRIWKFRSMVADASELKHLVENQVKGPLFKNECDPRITRIGRFLRKTSLDEFPQFWNVLKGEMSLVGTRPPTTDEVECYEINDMKRLDVKPGLTGEWQVNGRSEITDFAEVLRLDLQYQQNWNLIYDFKLIFKTIGLIFSKRNGAC